MFTLAVARHRSTGDDSQRLGSLFLNPGGPGGSGLDALPMAWSWLPPEVQDRYDLVTWDPRGVGRTTPAPIACPPPASDITLPLAGPVDWARVGTQLAVDTAGAHAACEAANAGIVGHLSTNEAVADLESLRAAVGDPMMNYWGWSYGTRIGYDYALTYPDRVGRMVLDSPMYPDEWSIDRAVQFALAPGQSYDVFAQYYPEHDRYLDQVLRAVRVDPIVLPSGGQLDRWSIPTIVNLITADEGSFPFVATLVEKLHQAALGTGNARDMARIWLDIRISSIAASISNLSAWWVPSAIWCLDSPVRHTPAELLPSTEVIEADWTAQEALSLMSAASLCSGYSFAPDPVPSSSMTGAPANPVLVLGSRWDGRTFGGWIDPMARALGNATSITYRGAQHVVYGTVGSGCVDRAVTRYLLTGITPAADLRCPSTFAIGQLVD
jgi:pimeloyl-ACP methyl ester carboxylesterase